MKLKKAATGRKFPRSPAAPRRDTLEELMNNIKEAVEGCLSVEVEEPKRSDKDRVLEIVV